MTSSDELSIGVKIRLARTKKHWSQKDLGQKVGYSASTISRIEAGRKDPDVKTRKNLATELEIPPADLEIAPDTPPTPGLSHARPTAARLAARPMQEGGDRVPLERRGFIAGIAAAGMGVLNSTATATRAADTPQDLVTGLERALFTHAETGGEVTIRSLGAQLAIARTDFHAGRYRDLGRELPRLVSAAEACRALQSGTAADQAAALEADSLALASEWAFKAHQDALASVYADRALKAAKQSGSVTSIGEASRQQAIAMRRAGHFDPATELLVLNAQAIGGEYGRASDQTLAVYGSLLLTAAYSQAQHGRRAAAQELLAEAHSAAARMKTRPGTGSFASDFGVGQADVYAIGIYHAVADTGMALEYTKRVRPERLPTDERRARYAVDAARVYRSAGKNEECYHALCAVGSYAPEELRRPSVRALIEDLRYAPGLALAGLPELARRAGATA